MSLAAAFFRPGGPDVLRLIAVAEPAVGPEQVLVRVKAAGVQPYDVAVVAGQIHRQPDPAVATIPGNEFAVGDEVLGYGTLNSYQELLAVGPDQITAKPKQMPGNIRGKIVITIPSAPSRG